jgi:ankyrin repeat protein
MTALHHAAELGFDQIVTVLLAHKADTSLRVRNQTARELAAEKDFKRVLELLDAAEEIGAVSE